MAKTKISKNKKFKGNPRLITKKESRLLKDHIEELGDLSGVVYCHNQKAYVGGNQRSEVFHGAEIEFVETYDKPTKACTVAIGFIHYKGEKYAYREVKYTKPQFNKACIVANSDGGSFDWKVIEAEWNIPEVEGWGLKIPGSDAKIRKDKVREDEFNIPTLVKTNIKPGDIIEIGNHRLMCGDSTSKKDIKKLMDGKMLDLMVTDPPYNVNYQGSTGLKIQNDNMKNDAFYKFLLDFHKAFYGFTKEGGAWYVWHADSEGLNFRKAFEESGLMLKQCLIWVKNALVMGRQDYHWRHEPCLYGWKPGSAHYFIDDRTKTTVIEDQADISKMKKEDLISTLQEIMSPETKTTILRADKPKKNDVHPTMKPILLIAPLIENSSRSGEIVADGFLGSGSTMVAAHQLGRICYGMELDIHYCQVIIERMQKLDGELKIKVNGKKYTKPTK